MANEPPTVGSAASFRTSGSDDDLRKAYRRAQIADRRTSAESLLASAQTFIDDPSDVDSIERAESDARKALVLFARSLDWAEDTDDEEEAHQRMDQAGAWVRRTFGCHLTRTGTEYSQTCPVALAHNRIGMSVGGVAVRTCSLCGGDFSECEHMPGVAYLVPGGIEPLGWCRVCLKEACAHVPSQDYRVSVVAIIKEMDLVEVSLVDKPAHPEARLTSVGISISHLSDALGQEFVPGMEVSCDRCLLQCDGLIRHDFHHG